jgi:NitT/TauT family transport system substrate-binding protein
MKKGVYALVPALLAASLITGCRADREPPLRIGTVFWPTNELLFLAQERGWLNPSEFRLVEFVDDGEVVRGFRNHAIEAAWLSMDQALAVAQSGAVDPVILFLADESRGADAVIAQPDLITVADLKDRRVAAQINSVSAYLLDRALKQTGLAANNIRLVNLPPYRQLAAFRGRVVDAVVTYEPVRSQIIAAGGVEIFSSAATPFAVLRVLVIRRDYLESHEQRADTLCMAWNRAVSDIDSSAAARQWIARRLGAADEGFERMMERIRIISLSESREWLAVPRPQLLATMAKLQSEMLSAGLLAAPTPFDPLFRWPFDSGVSACRR